jgi:hypothetical protein
MVVEQLYPRMFYFRAYNLVCGVQGHSEVGTWLKHESGQRWVWFGGQSAQIGQADWGDVEVVVIYAKLFYVQAVLESISKVCRFYKLLFDEEPDVVKSVDDVDKRHSLDPVCGVHGNKIVRAGLE